MLYPDFKMRYAILGASEIASSSDNKVAVYALMDKIEFSRDRYRLGHTLVFFRAGALAFLEELRDDIVITLLRKMQGQVFKSIRNKVYEKKRDQRELIKVAQRNFRKYMALRDWGWFVIIQKTRPLIGMPDPTEELRILEEKAQATYGVYKENLDKKERLLQENVDIETDKKALLKTIDSEQGNMSQYHERLAKIGSEKGSLEGELVVWQDKLVKTEQNRVNAGNDKKDLELESVSVKKDIGDVEMVIQKLDQEKTNRDHNIKSLNDEIGNQDEVINKLNKEKKHISDNAAKAAEDLQVAADKVEHLNKVKQKLESTLDELEGSVEKEKRARGNLQKEVRKIEGELKIMQETVSEIERSKKELEAQVGRKDNDMIGYNAKLDDEQALVSRFKRESKNYREGLNRKSWRLNAKLEPRLSASVLIWPEHFKVLVSAE